MKTAGETSISGSNRAYQKIQVDILRHVCVDIVAPTADLGEYKVVVAPALHILSAEAAGKLKQFAKAGEPLILTPRSGVKDGSNAVVNCVSPECAF